MNRWDFNLNKYNQKCENIIEPFGYKFVNDAKNTVGADNFLKTEKSFNILQKLDKNQITNNKLSEENQKIADKMAWNICLNSIKGLAMNMFVMFMSGGASGIFGIIFIMYSIYNILKSVFNINETFKSVENNSNTNYLLQKICFIIINCAVFCYIMRVCSSSGLLPIKSGDYFYYIPYQEIIQNGVGNIF